MLPQNIQNTIQTKQKKSLMGNNQPQPKAPPPQRDQLDILLDLKMTQRRLESDSKKALKEQENNVKKAKQALQKNNEEGARLYLQTAASKQAESTNLLKMAQKIEYIQSQVKTAAANQDMMTQLSRITPIMAQYTQNMPIEQVYTEMNNFDQALDAMLVNTKIMDQMFNKSDGDVHTNLQVDMMLEQMKQEERIKMEELKPQQQSFQQLQQQQQQQQGFQQQKQGQQLNK